jgi:hypothetical protein
VVISNPVSCYHGAWDYTSAGHSIDGDDDSQPGSDYIATVSGSRVTADGIGLARMQR